MLDRETARELVESHINSSYDVDGDELIVVDEETIEKAYGWVFFYTSRRYLETEDINYLLAGNGPIIVERENGSVTQLGTARPTEEYIKEYEAHRG